MHAKNSGFSSEVRQDCCVCSSSDMSLPVNTTMCFALPSTDWKLRSIEGSTLCLQPCVLRSTPHRLRQITTAQGLYWRPFFVLPFVHVPSPFPSRSRSFPPRSRQSASFTTPGVPANRTPTVVAVVPIYGWRYECHLSLQRTQVDGPQLLVPACSEQPSDRFESQVAPAQSLFASAYSLSSKATVSACTEEGTAVRQTQDEVLKSTTNCLIPRVSLCPGT